MLIIILIFGQNSFKLKPIRSKEYVDVNQLAAVFGGGGHVRAAGCTLSCSLDDAIKQVLNVTQQRI